MGVRTRCDECGHEFETGDKKNDTVFRDGKGEPVDLFWNFVDGRFRGIICERCVRSRETP